MIKRDQYLDKLKSFKDKNVIKVVTGIRRCGKSTLFLLFQEYLKDNGIKDENIVSVNLEDADYRNIKTADQLYENIENRLQKDKTYVFVDEVQQVEDFQKAIDWLYVKENVDVYITGSNANLLSGELATLLSGRYVEIKMLPLSFKEYVSGFDSENYVELYKNYLTNSSFPGTLELSSKQDINMYLEGIYNTIIVKDVMTRKNMKNAAALDSLVKFMYDNIGNICSSNKIANTMTSAGRKISVPTVEEYLAALTESYVFYKTSRYDIKGKQHLTTGSKYYASDIGLRYFLLGSADVDMGRILENIVYLELIRRGYEVYIGKVGKAEVDFIAKRDGITEYYQVALSVLDKKTLERELNSLKNIKDHNQKILITMDQLPVTTYDRVRQMNAIDWLL